MSPIQNRVYKNISIPALKVWGKMLNRLNKNESLDIVSTYITRVDIAEAGIQDSDIEGLANFMNMIDEGKAKMILKELEDGKWKGSFRTTRDDVDVSAWAAKMNGGGHKKAAGFKVDGNVDEAMAKIFDIINT
jgi:phosphoesterase RecJ-like protein